MGHRGFIPATGSPGSVRQGIAHTRLTLDGDLCQLRLGSPHGSQGLHVSYGWLPMPSFCKGRLMNICNGSMIYRAIAFKRLRPAIACIYICNVSVGLSESGCESSQATLARCLGIVVACDRELGWCFARGKHILF